MMFKQLVFVLFHISLLEVKCLYKGDSCTKINKIGNCLPLSDCKPIRDEIDKAGNPMPPYMAKKLLKIKCGFDRQEPMVCCKGGFEIKTGKLNFTIRHGSAIEDHPNFKMLPTECGVSNDIFRIGGGTITGLFEMPWMVLLSYEHTELGPYYGCGGTLINEWYVLTAAHCIKLLSEKLRLNGVILGEHNTGTDPDCFDPKNCAPPVRNVTIDEAIIHENYKPTRLLNDIAIIRLSEPANFSLDSMKPICLPTTENLQKEASLEEKGLAAGWGITEKDIQSNVLLSVELPIVSKEKCIEMYKNLLQLSDSQFCAGGMIGKDACSGDSGGPLLYTSKQENQMRYMQRGIVSSGLKDCAPGGVPTVYTKVSYYIEWILNNMRDV